MYSHNCEIGQKFIGSSNEILWAPYASMRLGTQWLSFCTRRSIGRAARDAPIEIMRRFYKAHGHPYVLWVFHSQGVTSNNATSTNQRSCGWSSQVHHFNLYTRLAFIAKQYNICQTYVFTASTSQARWEDSQIATAQVPKVKEVSNITTFSFLLSLQYTSRHTINVYISNMITWETESSCCSIFHVFTWPGIGFRSFIQLVLVAAKLTIEAFNKLRILLAV
jgi:hypothetical protein